MQSVQRKFGKMMSKNPGDNTRVSVLLKDYEDADQVLGKVRGHWISVGWMQQLRGLVQHR
jgi:hypothetical protein